MTSQHSAVVADERLPGLLQHLAQGAGRQVSESAIRRALERARGDSWQATLQQAGAELGVHVSARRPSFAAAVDDADHGPGLALVGPKGTIVAVEERRGSTFVIAGERAPIDRAALQQLLGVTAPDEAVVRLVAEPLSPLAAHEPVAGGGAHHPSSRARLFALLRLESADLWIVAVYAAAVGMLSLGVPVAVQALVNNVAFGLILQPVVVLTILLFAVLALSGVLRALQAQVVEAIQQRVFVKVAAELADRLPRARAEALDGGHAPELVNRFFDVLTVQKSAATLLLDGVALVLQAGIGMVLLAFYHPVLFAFDVVLVAAVAAVVVLLGRRGEPTAIAESYAKYAVAAWLEELARHPHAFKAAGARAFALERADELLRTYLGARRAHFAVVFRQMVGSFALQAVASALLLGLGGALVIAGQLTLGQLVAAELVVGVVLASVAKIGKQLESWYDLLAAMDKVGHLLDLGVEPAGGARGPVVTGPAALSLRGLGFSYPDGTTLFDRVDLEVRSGERIAISGHSGGGKSTLADLLYGLRMPATGALLLDGADVRSISRDELRAAVALVRQPEIFQGTVWDNVRLGRTWISDDDVRRAVAAVGLERDVSSLPQGLDTELATDGSPLSLGQARRLAIARAIAGRPRLLVIDEMLEGLAPAARDAVVDALTAPDAPWTLVCITHVPEMQSRCARHLRLEHGHLVEEPR